MQYMLLIYTDEQAMQAAGERQSKERFDAYVAYTEALRDSGALIGGSRLQYSSSATTVRTVNGSNKVLDGPYAETKEQLGGYYLIEAPDLDAALSWAARCPGARSGVMEVRPLWT
jgi:hypothetical protein